MCELVCTCKQRCVVCSVVRKCVCVQERERERERERVIGSKREREE